ncbi:MAG: AMP-binding protein, partial [Acidiferrobacterales bacterium]
MAGPANTPGGTDSRQTAPSENIEAVLNEDRRFEPPAGFSSRAHIKSLAEYQALRVAAERDPVAFWSGIARAELDWHKPFRTAFDDSRAPYYSWFADGLLNVSYNCLDRHLAGSGEKTAILFEGEPGDVRRISYAELHRQVCRFANALKARGIGLGDRVVIYMPMVPAAVVAMLACTLIGAIHSVVFGGFASGSLRNRIEDASARAVVTADGGHRGGKI